MSLYHDGKKVSVEIVESLVQVGGGHKSESGPDSAFAATNSGQAGHSDLDRRYTSMISCLA